MRSLKARQTQLEQKEQQFETVNRKIAERLGKNVRDVAGVMVLEMGFLGHQTTYLHSLIPMKFSCLCCFLLLSMIISVLDGISCFDREQNGPDICGRSWS